MKRRWRAVTTEEIGAWPDFDAAALAPDQRQVFKARRLALELYAAGTAITQIEARARVDRRQLYRLLDRCVEIHEDGRAFGFRALVRYARVGGYERVRPFKTTSASGFGAAAGAFSLLLQAYPGLAAWIKEQINGRRITLEQLGTDGGLRTQYCSFR